VVVMAPGAGTGSRGQQWGSVPGGWGAPASETHYASETPISEQVTLEPENG